MSSGPVNRRVSLLPFLYCCVTVSAATLFAFPAPLVTRETKKQISDCTRRMFNFRYGMVRSNSAFIRPFVKPWSGGAQRQLAAAIQSSAIRPLHPPCPLSQASGHQISMKLRAGIVGLPNVGKSTLFNALTGGATAQAANFPFCTIEPNVGIAEVPDPRLLALANIAKSESVLPAVLEFVDIAGLVKGASQGEGLGNKFLANIRECDAIVQVIRCFENDDIVHVSGSVDPERDMEVINLELALSDLAQVEKRLQRALKDKSVTQAERDGLQRVYDALAEGKPAREILPFLSEDELADVGRLGLLTGMKVIYAANVGDAELATGNKYVDKVREVAAKEGAGVVLVSAQVEAELVELPLEDRKEFLESLGVQEEACGLRALVKETYSLLGLQTYFTCGPKETRAWTIKKGSTAPQAAGVIHSDFEKGFIRAETMSCEDLVALGSEKAVKDAGKLRSEGKEYVCKEGDVMLFRFNTTPDEDTIGDTGAFLTRPTCQGSSAQQVSNKVKLRRHRTTSHIAFANRTSTSGESSISSSIP
ncbi:gtp-binding protein [Nannochloropsis gaditana]|uniref:Obg-like ATPase 1 n=1 Tax=Nannochloropsis gaditana TaxID=72520 RepID=W7TL68_9STRA|nr:gtp-binding protein [Nannochloropsis gaditana]